MKEKEEVGGGGGGGGGGSELFLFRGRRRRAGAQESEDLGEREGRSREGEGEGLRGRGLPEASQAVAGDAAVYGRGEAVSGADRQKVLGAFDVSISFFLSFPRRRRRLRHLRRRRLFLCSLSDAL